MRLLDLLHRIPRVVPLALLGLMLVALCVVMIKGINQGTNVGIYLKDHGVPTTGIIVDKAWSSSKRSSSFRVWYKFYPAVSQRYPVGTYFVSYQVVPDNQYNLVAIGQSVLVHYNQNNPASSTIYIGAMRTDDQFKRTGLLLSLLIISCAALLYWQFAGAIIEFYKWLSARDQRISVERDTRK